jgi:hypothetical protein
MLTPEMEWWWGKMKKKIEMNKVMCPHAMTTTMARCGDGGKLSE